MGFLSPLLLAHKKTAEERKNGIPWGGWGIPFLLEKRERQEQGAPPLEIPAKGSVTPWNPGSIFAMDENRC